MSLDFKRITSLTVVPNTQKFRLEYDDPSHGPVPIDVKPGEPNYEDLKTLYLHQGGERAKISKRLQAATSSFKKGVLYIKLSEKLDPEKMKVRIVLARVDYQGVQIELGDNDPASSAAKLSWPESILLGEAIIVVEAFWLHDRLPLGHVLLRCGHIIDWDKLHTNREPEKSYQVPNKDMNICCEACSDEWNEWTDQRVFRFHLEDFM